MKVAFLSYPMLFQNIGGLQVQIRETANALVSLGADVRLIDPAREHLTEYELVHVFSAINGNYRVVEYAAAFGIPVLVSPLIRPYWTRPLGRKARFLESVVGSLTGWLVHTEYREIETCLRLADHLVALGSAEKRAIVEGFRVPPASVTVVPNGIPDRFFRPDRELFCRRYDISPGYVLNVATVSPHKNQLALAEALSGTGMELVIIGPCLDTHRDYLAQVTKHPHVRYLGPLDYSDPALPSAYALASVFCLPSQSEVMPLSVLESLAAGTPSIMTKHHGMDLGTVPRALDFVEPSDRGAIRRAVMSMRAATDVDACLELARRYTWRGVAEALIKIYGSLIASRSPISTQDVKSCLLVD
ncbi:glycosyltransferase family 4 protein [Zeimonas arvi]|uniref:Glycosyltransferase family 4 protein n=1 Tax=Zeimonas arvi TaxID=2498847 RepID=A0A5C8NY17_9BURK|nr:glycosyltransferase family 4 protein [Zeimonas arvi]TXL65952.1 glycosyltransferase family 4 protein [Zeimonas arvi]